MKASDLMVGDWVYNKHHKKNIQITPYDFFNHGHNGFGKQFLPTNPKLISGNDFDPIPLTEEILLKNGFDKDERSKYYHDYILELELWDFDISWSSVNGFRYGDIKLTYVHQLQHLLRLCGIKKEIEL